MDTIVDGVGLMSTSEWAYVRTNSKDEKVFRRNTNESLSFVTEYLDEKKILYEIVYSAGLLFIENEIKVTYVYYWSTGRWSKKKRTYNKHYHSKGIDHFTTTYLNDYSEEQQTRQKQWDLEKQERDAKRAKEQSKTKEERIAEYIEKKDAVRARRTELRRAKNANKKLSE